MVVSLHWGSNWGFEVEEEHVSFAHALVERGVDVVHGHSSHHPRPIEIHAGRLLLYGCGDFMDDYEGIAAYPAEALGDSFARDLRLAYLPRVDAATGELLELSVVPMRERRMRLERVTAEDAADVARLLSRVSAAYGSRVVVAGDHQKLVLRTAQASRVTAEA